MFPLAEGILVEMRAIGEALDQRVEMGVTYYIDDVVGTPNSTGFLAQYAIYWNDEMMELFSSSLFINYFSLRRVAGIYLTEDEEPAKYYDLEDILVDSQQGERTGAMLPTYVSANIRKRSAGSANTGYLNGPPVPAIVKEKFFRGHNSHGTLSEEDTEGTAGNDLTEERRLAIETGWAGLRVFDYTPAGVEDFTARMVTTSMLRNGQLRLNGADEPVLAYQFVAAVQVPLKVGSQLSRKARAAF